jgi:hypothetical protein
MNDSALTSVLSKLLAARCSPAALSPVPGAGPRRNSLIGQVNEAHENLQPRPPAIPRNERGSTETNSGGYERRIVVSLGRINSPWNQAATRWLLTVEVGRTGWRASAMS